MIAREDIAPGKTLVAYWVAAETPPPAAQQELRSFLRRRMPDYMVPSAFVRLESLPLTPNGKVDRSALPAPDDARQEQVETPVAPRDGLEMQLRQIWEKVLRVRPVGIRDNFFDLGGHSLLAVRLFAQIEERMGKKLPVAALFHAPTIEQLARLMSRQEWSTQWKSLVAIQPGEPGRRFFASTPMTAEFCSGAIWPAIWARTSHFTRSKRRVWMDESHRTTGSRRWRLITSRRFAPCSRKAPIS